jgi:hypothetical protein
MELKEFIAETLKQLTEGIKEGHDHIVKQNLGKGIEDAFLLPVKFDIAITITDEDKGTIGGKIGIANVFSAGGEKENSNSNSTLSRIQFELSVSFKTK